MGTVTEENNKEEEVNVRTFISETKNEGVVITQYDELDLLKDFELIKNTYWCEIESVLKWNIILLPIVLILIFGINFIYLINHLFYYVNLICIKINRFFGKSENYEIKNVMEIIILFTFNIFKKSEVIIQNEPKKEDNTVVEKENGTIAEQESILKKEDSDIEAQSNNVCIFDTFDLIMEDFKNEWNNTFIFKTITTVIVSTIIYILQYSNEWFKNFKEWVSMYFKHIINSLWFGLYSGFFFFIIPTSLLFIIILFLLLLVCYNVYILIYMFKMVVLCIIEDFKSIMSFFESMELYFPFNYYYPANKYHFAPMSKMESFVTKIVFVITPIIFYLIFKERHCVTSVFHTSDISFEKTSCLKRYSNENVFGYRNYEFEVDYSVIPNIVPTKQISISKLQCKNNMNFTQLSNTIEKAFPFIEKYKVSGSVYFGTELVDLKLDTYYFELFLSRRGSHETIKIKITASGKTRLFNDEIILNF